eukprot:SAG11_NODE_3577_length_2359_cov_1.198673_3_plen_99_part_00
MCTSAMSPLQSDHGTTIVRADESGHALPAPTHSDSVHKFFRIRGKANRSRPEQLFQRSHSSRTKGRLPRLRLAAASSSDIEEIELTKLIFVAVKVYGN